MLSACTGHRHRSKSRSHLAVFLHALEVDVVLDEPVGCSVEACDHLYPTPSVRPVCWASFFPVSPARDASSCSILSIHALYSASAAASSPALPGAAQARLQEQTSAAPARLLPAPARPRRRRHQPPQASRSGLPLCVVGSPRSALLLASRHGSESIPGCALGVAPHQRSAHNKRATTAAS